jgi:hypothetical protein
MASGASSAADLPGSVGGAWVHRHLPFGAAVRPTASTSPSSSRSLAAPTPPSVGSAEFAPPKSPTRIELQIHGGGVQETTLLFIGVDHRPRTTEVLGTVIDVVDYDYDIYDTLRWRSPAGRLPLILHGSLRKRPVSGPHEAGFVVAPDCKIHLEADALEERLRTGAVLFLIGQIRQLARGLKRVRTLLDQRFQTFLQTWP